MVKLKAVQVHAFVRAASYLYLILPVIIFFLGWCRWQVGVPAALILAVSFVLCFKEHKKKEYNQEEQNQKEQNKKEQNQKEQSKKRQDKKESGQKDTAYFSADIRKLAVIGIVVLVWTGLSGVGGYAWQNADHPIRNELFVLLVKEKWPLVKAIAAGGAEPRGMVYYLGFWLPAAAAGKLFGLKAGWAAQYLWAAAGILLMYAWICIWRKKVIVWPLWIIIFFSGLDAAGVLLFCRQELQVFGEPHLEAWAPYYQFSCMTTQLFWVFNQAVPAWLLAAVVFLGERPKNLCFLTSLTVLTSTFPFVGMVPYVLYFMVSRSDWKGVCQNLRALLKSCWGSWASFQNIAGSAVTLFICGIYIAGNHAVRNSMPWLNNGRRLFLLLAAAALAGIILWLAAVCVLRGHGKLVFRTGLVLGILAVAARFGRLPYADWQSPLFYWINLTLFYIVEAGVFLLVLYPAVEDKRLFLLNAAWLYVIPLILVGRSCDFCMRASIPGLFLLMLWCIHAADAWMHESGRCKKQLCLLLALLMIGTVTPLHEIKRSFVNTREPYENRIAGEEEVLMGNNFSGSTAGFFWRCLAKPYDVKKQGE